MSEVVITKELLSTIGSCYVDSNLSSTDSNGDSTSQMLGAVGLYSFFENNDLWDKPESHVANVLRSHGHLADLNWYFNAKKTEAYVRFVGKVITMGQYQVFNPITGLHTYCETLSAAKAAMADIANQVLANAPQITICQEISNEHGDTTWISTQIPNAFLITPTE